MATSLSGIAGLEPFKDSSRKLFSTKSSVPRDFYNSLLHPSHFTEASLLLFELCIAMPLLTDITMKLYSDLWLSSL